MRIGGSEDFGGPRVVLVANCGRLKYQDCQQIYYSKSMMFDKVMSNGNFARANMLRVENLAKSVELRDDWS